MLDNFDRVKNLPVYVFNVTHELKSKYIDAGIDIIDFSMGNPDQDTPKEIIQELIKGVEEPFAHRYASSQGIDKLRQSMKNWLHNRFDLNLDPKSEIIVTLGSKEGISHLSMAMINAGEKVFVPEPCYPIHKYAFILAGAEIISLNGMSGDLLIDDLKVKLNHHRPKVLILNFPTNPTTDCVNLYFFAEIISLAKKYEFWIIHDFAYADIIFSDKQHPSILQVPGAKDVAVETYSMSKSFNMPGWRIGFVYGNKKLVHALKMIKSYYDYGTYGPIQKACSFALDNYQKFVPQIVKKYKERRDYLSDGLNNIGWEVIKPDATMFIWAKIPKKYSHLNSLKFSELLLNEANISITPGMSFGKLGDEYVRFSLIQENNRVDIALSKLEKILSR